MIKACISVTCTNMALMMTATVLYILIEDLLNDNLASERIPVYAVMSAVIILLIAVTEFIQYNSTFLSTYKESGVRRATIAERLRKLPLSYFDKKNLADLTTNIMGDCAMIETASSHWIPEMIGAIISTTLVGISMFIFFDWRMALASFWVIPVAFLIVTTCSGAEKRAARKNHAVKMTMTDGVQECLESIRDLRANNAEDSYMEELDVKIKNVEKMALFTELKMAVYVNSAAIILKIGIGTRAVVGGILFAQGEITILTFFMFLMLVSRLYDPMQITLQNFAAIIATGIQCERLDEVLSAKIQTGSDKMNNDGFDIVFDHVGFKYSDDTDVLKDVSFTAKQGEVTALIGPSGGGKTTAASLIPRFWDVNSGSVSVGGVDVRETDPHMLMDQVAFVFQNNRLFKASVLENVRAARPDASRDEVQAALTAAQCDDILEKLPDGMDTVIGTEGTYLSGGEQQRVALARAILKDASIVVLDEATAFADPENEVLIQKAFSALTKGRTVIMIAHRLSTVIGADKIIVLDSGHVAEEGTHVQLASAGGLYARMWTDYNKAVKWKISHGEPTKSALQGEEVE